ncbi:MAG: sensor domain-containing diguanylate cyclase [Proteobacteria bacterium]|nr:sensor domain-containing diguanylate cyclase [Pseudomonadota bacterium]NOG59876.1 sensor domain-containing diguanylate cyclase [Pseudomonadota bacterium]
MEHIIKGIIGKLETPDALNTRFTQLLNSLSGIRTIANLGHQQIDKENLIDAMMQTIIENLGVEVVSLYLLEKNSLKCVANLNWEEFIANESSIKDGKTSYLLSEGIIGKTATNRQLVHIRNCNISNENFVEYEMNGRKIGSLICTPIMANNSVIGVIELSHPDPNNFESWQEHSIVIYADLIGILLNNLKLVKNMQNIVDARTKELNQALIESEKLRVRYEEMSVIDPLTKLYNRRYFFTEVTSSLARAKRYIQSFSLLLMDLDHFKTVNDTHGHECGDKVLIDVGRVLGQFTREGDTLARIGGEEFVLALPETNKDGALKLADRIRTTIENSNWECNGNIIDVPIRISIGIASLADCNDDEIHDDDIQISDILRKADLALYHVKQHGRNNIITFSDIP